MPAHYVRLQVLELLQKCQRWELMTRRCIYELEGMEEEISANPKDPYPTMEIPRDILDEYADSDSERHNNLVEMMNKKLRFDSLKFQRLDDLLRLFKWIPVNFVPIVGMERSRNASTDQRFGQNRVVESAKALEEMGVEIISTGGTL